MFNSEPPTKTLLKDARPKKVSGQPKPRRSRAKRFAPGMTFAGRYRLVHLLGKGGMGAVYRADDLRLGQTIALKFLSGPSAPDSYALARFRDEARLARRISHSGVCRIFDFGESGDLTYIAMEYIEGENLAALLRRIGHPPFERALEIGLEICAALGAIHEQGILHRDLKPANIMIDDNGRARILDFGVAAPTEKVSKARTHGGTPAYMAPEQACGLALTPRSDLYSLGLVLRELWTGSQLGDRERDDPPLISEQRPEVHPSIDRMVARLLAVDPLRRPASAESVAVGLRRSLEVETGKKLRTVVAIVGLEGDPDHDPLGAGDLLEAFGGQEVWDDLGRLWIFERPWDAVSCVVALRELPRQPPEIKNGDPIDIRDLQLALEVAEVDLRARRSGEPGTGELILAGEAAPLARAMAKLALPGQTLLSADTCRLARRGGRAVEGGDKLTWLSHGRYHLLDRDEPMEVFEVGTEGQAPLQAPVDPSTVLPAASDGTVPGWRPAPAVDIPPRPNFQIERRLGGGGFGEAWLARHRKTGERRVFKFCFETSRLRGLRREITLFRLLKEELGDRDDIARVLDWNLDHPPYFIESEYTEGGDVTEWAETQGGVDKIPLADRLELVAQVAEALAAAHSVGVLHKDVKPSNILMTSLSEGGFRARLADFGVGLITNTQRLAAAGITAAGWTGQPSGSGGDPSGGTPLYLAPEVIEGNAPTIQSDIYALGVVLYQLVVGQLGRAVAPGWRDGIQDDLLADDIAAALHGDPEGRLESALELSRRLRTLEERTASAREEALRKEKELQRQERAARVRRIRTAVSLVLVLVSLATLAGWALQEQRLEAKARLEAEESRREAEESRIEAEESRREAEFVTTFLIELFSDDYNQLVNPSAPDPVSEVSASELLERGLERLQSAEVHPRVKVDLIEGLGNIFLNLGDSSQAFQLFEEGLEVRKAYLDPQGLEIAASLVTLGNLGTRMMAPREGEPYLREAVEIHRARLPEDDPALAESLLKLARNLSQQGAYEESIALAREALKIHQSIPGSDRLVLSISMELVGTFEEAGIYSEAEVLSQQALALSRELFGSSHIVVAHCLDFRARVLFDRGEFAEAETLSREALRISQELFGERSPRVAFYHGSLGWVLTHRGRFSEAEAHLREALALRKESLHVALIQSSLAETLFKAGSIEQAEVLWRESLAKFETSMDKESPRILVTRTRLAMFLAKTAAEDTQEAERLLEESLRTLRMRHPPDFWLRAYARAVEATISSRAGRFEEAEAMLLESHRSLSLEGARSLRFRESFQRLVTFYEDWGRPEEAQRYRDQWQELADPAGPGPTALPQTSLGAGS